VKGKNFYNLRGGCSKIGTSDVGEEYTASNDALQEDRFENLTAEKVFFNGFNKKLPVEEHSTLLKITKVSLVKNSI
jgi:hypothetical protein